mgnify:CR=1 FL=1
MTAHSDPAAPTRLFPPARVTLGGFSWALFEGGRNPFTLVILIYLYGPYFSGTIVGDPTRGQVLWGYVHTAVGISLALSAPILGAIADQGGARKPWIGALSLIMIVSCFSLWGGMPHSTDAAIVAIAFALYLATLTFDLTAVFHNAMLPSLIVPQRLGLLSGMGLGLGNLASLLILLFVLIFFALPGEVDLSFVPKEPLLGLDREMSEHNRIAGPIIGLWMAVFALPLFLFTPDVARVRQRWSQAIRNAVKRLIETVRSLRDHRDAALFLGGRMFFNDAKTAIMIFGGVYANGVFGWETTELLFYGVSSTIFAVIGGFLGGAIDSAIGSKRALILWILTTMTGAALAVSMAPGEVLFISVGTEPLHNGPIFQTAAELGFIGSIMVLAISITGGYVSSRTMMARLAPEDKMAEFFGLYAFSGTATAWMAPIAISTVTAITDSQRAGFSAVGIFLIIGLLFVLAIRMPNESKAG